MIPRATVRLQLNPGFGFDAARDCIDYYAALGVSHLYLSPIFRARAGSMHGYDTVDFSRVSGELGGAPALKRLADAVHERGMGIIVDIVPNHMGVAANDNPWWNDVLANGRHSAFADCFDIDWTPADPALRDKVLLPVLAAPCADLLAAGGLGVARDDDGDARVTCGAASWPLSPASAADAGDVAAFDARRADGRKRLRALLERQHYVLDDWRRASDRINWRRFFDIGELAALRVEDPRVFDAVHRELFALVEAGIVDGVRVDHVDGLADPLGYCQRLRQRLEASALGRTSPSATPERSAATTAYIVVEKVFGAHEPRRDWGVAGTTGYGFMDQVSAWLHNPDGQAALDVLWRDTSGRPWELHAAVAQARREVLLASFRADLARATRAFLRVAGQAPESAVLSSAGLERALIELVVAFPVYRCYGLPGALLPEDAAILATAVERANRELAAGDYAALDFLARCLRETPAAGDEAMQNGAAVRFQQLTAAIAARAIEDTIFYREMRLLSRNEVGSDPNVFSIGSDEFHADCLARARRFPHGLLATATHDHKRGEDARARLAVLSEHADAWCAAVARWRGMNAALHAVGGTPAAAAGTPAGPAPDPVDELMLYQTLAGAWPLMAAEATHDSFRERIAQWWRKALREGKRHTSWLAPDEAYESACRHFLAAILAAGTNPFVEDLRRFVDAIAAAGALNGLTQTFLRLTTPGVPDLYQGCEFWDFSLVDPDNRRPVDYRPRRSALTRAPSLAQALGGWRDGVVKQQLIARVLRHRAQHPDVYAHGDYHPLAIHGPQATHAIAFERRINATRLVCVATRWPLSLAGGDLPRPLVPPSCWGDTRVEIESGAAFVDVLHEQPAVLATGTVRIADLLARFPVAMYFARAASD